MAVGKQLYDLDTGELGAFRKYALRDAYARCARSRIRSEETLASPVGE